MIGEESEKQVLSLLKSGRPKDFERACEVIYNQFSQRIYVFVSAFLKNKTDAQDVLQNTWSKVFSNIDRFKGQSSLYTWIYRIAYNECINWIKSRDYGRFTEADLKDTYHTTTTSTNSIDFEKAARWFDEAVDILPPRQRAVFIMRYFDEMPYEKISRITGLSEGSLKASFHHAAAKIEKYVIQKLNEV